MKKQILLILSLCLVIFSQAQTATAPSIGDGTSSNPYQIATLDNLYWLSQNSGEWSKYFIQTADIDASTTYSWNSGAGWAPIITTNISETSLVYFTGSYDGTGHSISGLTINSPKDRDYIGLFAVIYGSTVKNLGMINVNITSGGGQSGGDAGAIGSLCGVNYSSTVLNCYATGNVTGGSGVGGLIGLNYSSSDVENCFSTCTVSTPNNTAGGLIGINQQSSVKYSYASGSVSCTGTTDNNGTVGGLIGYNDSLVVHCYATGAVSACSEVGGLIGRSNSEDEGAAFVDSCYATGAVSVIGSQEYTSAGGLVGENYSSAIISHSYATGSVIGQSISSNVGGLVGNNYTSPINNCFATGVVSGGGSTGGLIGQNGSSSIVNNSYARGNVTGTQNNVGGLVGRNASSSVTNSYSTGTAYSLGCYGGILGSNEGGASISNSFWDTNTSGLTGGCGYNEGTFNATGKPTTEMKTQSTFTNAGWDFTSIWNISESNNDGYPKFIWQSTINAVIETKVDNKISLYPNPATDAFQLTGIEGTATVTLSDLSGRLLISKEVTTNETVSVSTLPNGVYLVTIKSKDITETEKLIIQH